MASFDDKELLRWMADADERARQGRKERLRFLLPESPEGGILADALAYEYYLEARLCWYMGAFVAAILMAQLALEEVLRSQYRRAGPAGKVDHASFAELTDWAARDGWISSQEAPLLHRLRREIRNPYVHTKDTEPGSGTRPDWLRQYVKIRAAPLGLGSAEDEARECIGVLVRLFPALCCRRFWGLDAQ